MKKQVAIVTESFESADFYKKRLDYLFENRIDIVTYSLKETITEKFCCGDIYIIDAASSASFNYVFSLIEKKDAVVIPHISFTKDAVERLKYLPKGTKAMFVNVSANTAVESIAELYRLGVTHIKLYPVYPESKGIPNLKLAVTPGERQLVPEKAREVIDIGHRTFTLETLVEITRKLDFLWFLRTEKYQEYAASLAEKSLSMTAFPTEAFNMESKFESLLEALEMGIIGIDSREKIFAVNGVASEILEREKNKVIGKRIWREFPLLEKSLAEVEYRQRISKLIQWEGRSIHVVSAPVWRQQTYQGSFFILERFAEEKNKQRKLCPQILERGHVSRYTFEDIIGFCPVMEKVKAIAKKMAVTDASILLTGESGTGKELFAHSIHHGSRRWDMPFITVNCAALPERLLEGELFGYLEGVSAGTGKGGKPGLFECAYGGTLFLDKIEGMSLNLQRKLLCVLQEKEEMPTGENKIAPLDVRIIAATSRDIRELIQKGEFRKDLYYRLNTLPIEIPPLRERGEDIFDIMRAMKKSIGAVFELTEYAKAVFLNYQWDGNVRELKNVVEYLKYLGQDVIDVEDLPKTMQEKESVPESIAKDKALFLETSKEKFTHYLFVLKVLHAAKVSDSTCNRKMICEMAENKGISLTEQNVREILSDLSGLGLAIVARGRGGSRITQKGECIRSAFLAEPPSDW